MAPRDAYKMRVWGVAGAAALVPAVLIVWGAIGPVWGSLAQASGDADLVRRFKALVAEKPAYQAALVRARGALAGQNMLYHDASAELAGAEMQNAVQNLVSQAGGQVRSSEIGATETAQGIQTISVSLDCSLPQDRLAAMLATFDTQKPYLVVQALDVRATDAGDRNAALDVQLTVNGFRDVP